MDDAAANFGLHVGSSQAECEALPITPELVRFGYLLFLGREPESLEAVQGKLAQLSSLVQLRRSFIESQEFKGQAGDLGTIPVGRQMLWPPIHVETEASGEQMSRMFARLRDAWTRLGREEPHYSVMLEDAFRPDQIRQTEDEFYASGTVVLDILHALAARNGVDLSEVSTAVELGCGLGRVTLHLAREVGHVTGIDISRSHLEGAAARVRQEGVGNVDLIHLADPRDLSGVPGSDLFLSMIVLQHDPPPVSAWMLDEMLAKVNPGGLALFQVPTYRLDYNFSVEAYLATSNDRMEMHVLPQAEVFARLRRHGFEVLEVQEETWAGEPAFVSQTFFARKTRPGGASV